MVFACSGAADVGGLTDQAARKLSREKAASMCCTAAVAAGIPEILDKVRAAGRVLVLDGCGKVCAKIVMENAGFAGFSHLQLEDAGFKKGESPVNGENVNEVAVRAESLLRAE